MSEHLAEAMVFLKLAEQAVERHVDVAPSPRSRQQGTEVAAGARRLKYAAQKIINRDRTAARGTSA